MTTSSAAETRPLVIAHRGASGYLPEHTLAAAAYAHALGADAIEQDVVMTRDDELLVLHDIHLDAVTDVATRFPDRARPDGRFHAIDFTLAEIRTLAVRERFNPQTGEPVFPQRFPRPDAGASVFRLATLDEHLALIQGLNRSTGRTAAVYPEFKAPRWHREQGRDPGRALLETLARHGYRERDDPAWVQCFDPRELRRLREELGTRLRLVQLIAPKAWGEAEADFDAMRTPAGLDSISEYADGIGPWLPHVVERVEGGWRPTALVADAHRRGLVVHPYTFRADDLPAGVESFDALHEMFFRAARIDGVFTDFADRTIAWLTRAGMR